jgi:hypothetical protein
MSRKKYDLGLSFSTIIPRMMEMQGIKKDVELAKLLGITTQSITAYKTGRYKDNDIPPEWVLKFLIRTKSDLGELLQWGPSAKGEGKSGAGAALEKYLPEDLILVLCADEGLRHAGGVGKIVMELPESYLGAVFKENKHNLTLWVMDDDNMDPFIRRNELMIIDNRFKKINGGGIYAFKNQEGKIKIRRVYERLEGGIDIVNDNRAYESHRGPTLGSNVGKLEILGRVVGFYRAI